MGTLLIESAIGKNYGNLKRSLINSMTQKRNRYHNSKADAYTILCRYIPKNIKNKNESTTIGNRPATGVPICQRATTTDGPLVEVTNGITEDMITCCKYGRHGHRSLLFPKSNNKGFQGMQLMFTQGMHSPFERKFTHPS